MNLGEGKEIPITNRAQGISGWGDVNDEFPTENKQGNAKTYFYHNKEGYFQLCKCGITNPESVPPDKHSDNCPMNDKNEIFIHIIQ